MPIFETIVRYKDLCVSASKLEGEEAKAYHQRATTLLHVIEYRLKQIVDAGSPERAKVYGAINSEREYQDAMTASSARPDMIEDFHVGDGLSAIEHLVGEARREWYKGAAPHGPAMDLLRKVAGVIVKLGETYRLPYRT